MKRAALILAMAVAAGAMIWLAATTVREVSALKAEVSAARRDIGINRERLMRAERRMEEAGAAAPSPFEARSAAFTKAAPASMTVSAQAVRLLRDYIKLPPAPPGSKPTLTVGMPVSEAVLLPLPQQITDRATELTGARFTTDKDGSIVIVGKGSRRVDAIISPN